MITHWLTCSLPKRYIYIKPKFWSDKYFTMNIKHLKNFYQRDQQHQLKPEFTWKLLQLDLSYLDIEAIDAASFQLQSSPSNCNE